MKRVVRWLGFAVFVLAVGCSSLPEGITIQDPWVRPALTPGGNAAGYMVIRNGGPGDDALLEVRADFAVSAELHQTMQMEGDMASMQPVDRLEIPAGGQVALEPGGYHIMLIGVDESIEPGATVTLTLVFEQAGEVQVQAPIRRE